MIQGDGLPGFQFDSSQDVAACSMGVIDLLCPGSDISPTWPRLQPLGHSLKEGTEFKAGVEGTEGRGA